MKYPHQTILGPLIAIAVVASFLAFEIASPVPLVEHVDEPAPVPSIPAVGGPFSLVAHTGQPFTERNLEGKVRLVFFGFTSCPDVCPTALTLMTGLLDELDPKTLEEVRPIFVTVDPERDTVEVMKDYMSAFHPAIIGLTGTTATVDAMTKAYKVYYTKVPSEDGKDYTMEHSAGIYLFDRQGEFAGTMDLHEDPEVVRKKLTNLVERS